MGLKIVAGVDHYRHAPWIDLSDGPPGVQQLEQPARLLAVLDGLARLPNETTPVKGWTAEARALVARVHDAAYLDFLERCAGALGPMRQITPTHFGVGGPDAPWDVQAGRFCREIGTAITSGAWVASMNGAETVRVAAEAFLAADKGTRVVAATRPPGHHAAPARFGGYCFLNTAVLAATALREAGRRVAILDVDYHLGDGTLDFATPETRYYSLHADFYSNYPYLSPEQPIDPAAARLVALTEADDVASALAKAADLVAEINASGVDAVVLSLGFDLNGADAIQDLAVGFSPADFATLGDRLAALEAPVLTVLEGGYDLATLGDCAEAFFARFASGSG